MAVKNGYIAIYVNDAEIHAVEFTHGYKNIVLHNYGRVDLPNGVVKNGRIVEPNALQEKLMNLLTSTLPNPINSRELIFIVPEDLVFTHVFDMAGQLESEQLIKLIPDEAEKYIPFSRDDIYWDFAIAQDGKDATEVQYSAISKNILTEYLNIFKNLGLKPVLVTDSHEGYKILSATVNAKSVAVLELNKNNIKLICVKDGIVQSVSVFDFNYKQFLENIGQFVDPNTKKLEVDKLPMIDDIAVKINQEVKASKCYEGVSSFYVWGSQVKDVYLYSCLEKSLGAPLEVEELWDPINLASSINNNQDAITLINSNKIPFGIMIAVSSVYLYDPSTKCVNLLPIDERKNIVTQSFGKILSVFGLMIIAMNLGLIFLLAYFSLTFTFELYKLEKETQIFETLIYGDSYTQLKNDILSFNAEVEKLYTLDNSIVDLPTVFGKLTNTTVDGVELVRLSYNKETGALIINGIADTRKTLLTYKAKVESLDGIGNIDFPISNLDKSEDISFEINIKLNDTNEI